MTKYVYDVHAVRRIVQRRVPIDAIEQIARFGVTIQASKHHVMKRGEIAGKPVHVVINLPCTIKTVYIANEWSVTVAHHKAN